MAHLLTASEVSVSYGSVRALQDASLGIEKGDVVSVLGSNGAGKSTLLRAVMGLVPVTGGSLDFDGVSIRALAPHRIVRMGASFVPEGMRLFQSLTVEDNLRVGAPRDCPDFQERVSSVCNKLPGVGPLLQRVSRTLSGGEQRLVAIGRAIMASPKLLVVDEPSFGLSPIAFERVLTALRELNENGTTILLAEQNAAGALGLSSYVYLLSNGVISERHSPDELGSRSLLAEAYLGVAG